MGGLSLSMSVFGTQRERVFSGLDWKSALSAQKGNGGEQVGIEGAKLSVCACECVCLWIQVAGCPTEYYNISVTLTLK